MKKLTVKLSPIAQSKYLEIRKYWLDEWTEKVALAFEEIVDQKIDQVAQFPRSCKVSNKKDGIYQAVVEKHTSFYYRIKNKTIEILIFVDNRTMPTKTDEQLKKFIP